MIVMYVLFLVFMAGLGYPLIVLLAPYMKHDHLGLYGEIHLICDLMLWYTCLLLWCLLYFVVCLAIF